MRKLLAASIPTFFTYKLLCSQKPTQPSLPSPVSTIAPPPLKTRSQHLSQVQQNPNYDVVIIGGGCNGAGVALEASSRGLRTLLIQSDDFGNGASSKSTKLIHGGLRYLQAVFMSRDSIYKRKENFALVKEALNDRRFMIQNASYMNQKLKFVIPYTSLFEQLYYYSGTLVYHLITWMVSGKQSKNNKNLKFTFPYFIGKMDLKAQFPFISNRYEGGIVFEDGQFNDAQMLLSILLTSTLPSNPSPSNILNQSQFINFIKDDNNKIKGIVFKDKLSNKQITIHSNYVINCTGGFADKIRQIDNPKATKRLIPVAGSHITFDKRITPGNHGIIVNSDDGRVLIVVPWLGKTVAGTTENKLEEPVLNPTITINEKRFIYDQMNKVFDDIAETELLRLERSHWTGIRPLVLQQAKDLKDTKQVSRKHVIEQSQSGLISLMGGKWTIYRQMGQDVVDLILKDSKLNHNNLQQLPSKSSQLRLIGDNYTPNMNQHLNKKYGSVIGNHMFSTYGSVAPYILSGNNEVLDPEIGITKSQISYIVNYQMPTQIEDVVLRRTRVAFLDRRKPKLIVPFVAEELAKVHGWSAEEKERKIQEFYRTYEDYEY